MGAGSGWWDPKGVEPHTDRKKFLVTQNATVDAFDGGEPEVRLRWLAGLDGDRRTDLMDRDTDGQAQWSIV